MSKRQLQDLDTDTLKNTRLYITGKHLVWQIIGSLNMFFGVSAFMAGGLWIIGGGMAVFAAYILKDVSTQLKMIETELDIRGDE